MRQSTYQALPLEALLDLLLEGVKKLLSAYELKEAGLSEFNAHKKYIEILLSLIEEKKKEKVNVY